MQFHLDPSRPADSARRRAGTTQGRGGPMDGALMAALTWKLRRSSSTWPQRNHQLPQPQLVPLPGRPVIPTRKPCAGLWHILRRRGHLPAWLRRWKLQAQLAERSRAHLSRKTCCSHWTTCQKHWGVLTKQAGFSKHLQAISAAMKQAKMKSTCI